MTEEKRASAASQRRARVGGLVLSRPQIILAGCGIVVGFLVCLVVGFIGGAWWQTQEQMAFRVDLLGRWRKGNWIGSRRLRHRRGR